MARTIGFLAVLVAAFSSVWLIARSYRAMRGQGRRAGNRHFTLPVLGVVAGAVVAMLALETALLLDDF